jgi:hypothetical protein
MYTTTLPTHTHIEQPKIIVVCRNTYSLRKHPTTLFLIECSSNNNNTAHNVVTLRCFDTTDLSFYEGLAGR